MSNKQDALKAPSFQPTPHVGMNVQWFPYGDPKNGARAAICTKIEAAGRIGVTVFGPHSEPKYYVGVLHVSHHNCVPHNKAVQISGAWDFIPGIQPKDPFELAKQEDERRRRALEEQQPQHAKSAATP